MEKSTYSTRRQFIKFGASTLLGLTQLPTLTEQTKPVRAQFETLTGVNMFDGLLRPNFEQEIAEAASMRASVVRVFIPFQQATHDTTSERLGIFLQVAKRHDMQVIPVLLDYYRDKGSYPPDIDRYYNLSNVPAVLDESFVKGGYKSAFVPFVKKIVTENMHHTNIFAWEPVNELRANGRLKSSLSFLADITQLIHRIDPYHDIAGGIASSAHFGCSPEEFYRGLPGIKYVTLHTYDDENTTDCLKDAIWARKNKRTVLVEEIGYSGPTDRSSRLEKGLDFWTKQNASAVLIWGFIGEDSTEPKGGDEKYGMDTIWHKDYKGLYQVLKTFGANVTLKSKS